MNEERRKQQILHILAAGIRKVMEEAHLDYGNYFCLQDGRKSIW